MNTTYRNIFKKSLTVALSAQLALSALLVSAPLTTATTAHASSTFTDQFSVTKLASYVTGAPNADGGVAEIVAYNRDNNKFYLVNGASSPPTMEIVTLGTSGTLTKDATVLIKPLVETGGFEFGDLTSVDVNTAIDRVFVSVQAKGVANHGKIVELDYAGNFIADYSTGVQPDMIVSTPDGSLVLTANEGEPRVAGTDPQGGITILDTVTDTVTHLTFDNPAIIDDNVHIRGTSSDTGQITGKGTKAEALTDLEPEYITIAADGKTAYVSLQENNAIATINLQTKQIVAVKGLGLKDHSLPVNALDAARNSPASRVIENMPFFGIYNPDGIANLTVGGQTYLFSANEGDATDFPGRKNASTITTMRTSLTPGSAAATFLTGKTQYNSTEVASDWGNDSIYLFGARSFSVWNATTMTQVFDSGSDFERITEQRFPANFNANHATTAMDNRSSRKGPEPEAVEIGKIGDRHFAFVALERIGGVMIYDVTNPNAPFFVNYTNTRAFTPSNNLNTDTGPEGLEFIPGAISPTGWPLLLVANEVSGTVAVLQINLHDDQTAPTVPSGLSATAITGTGLQLNWSASTDNIGVTKYEIYRDDVLLGESATNQFTVSGLTSATSYKFTVRACDAGTNCSAVSSALNTTTLDTIQPSQPGVPQIGSLSAIGVRLNWAPSTDNVAVQGYRVFVNGVQRTFVQHPAAFIRNLAPNTEYTFTIRAFDAARNVSIDSDPLTVTTTSDVSQVVDTIAPSAPTNLVSSDVTPFSFKVTWDASTDNVGVREYEVYRNGALFGRTMHNSFRLSNLIPGRLKNVQIVAVDAMGNKSALSAPHAVNTPVGAGLTDTEKPTDPTGFASSNVTNTGFRVSWHASTDNFFVFGYNVFINNVYVASIGGTSYNFSGLAPNTTYNIRVQAYDFAKNRSNVSAVFSVTTNP